MKSEKWDAGRETRRTELNQQPYTAVEQEESHHGNEAEGKQDAMDAKILLPHAEGAPRQRDVVAVA